MKIINIKTVLFHLIKIKYKIPYVLAGPIASKREKTSLKSLKSKG